MSPHPFRPALACLALLSAMASAIAREPAIQGRLEAFGEISAVRVWGSPRDMGFAHGYLLAPKVISGLSFDYAGLSPEQRAERDATRQRFASIVQVSPRLSEELEGILDGVRARLGDAAGEAALGRALTLGDLKYWNAFDAVRAFGCSGFTVWGGRAGEAGVITTRNFDFALLGDDMLERQVLLIREPAGRKKVAMVTLAGYLGAYTGVNEGGVCTFIHDGSGPVGATGFATLMPLMPALTDLLETSSPQDAQSGVEVLLKSLGKYPFSYMVRVVTPRVGDAPAERTFRIDASGVGENPSANGVCITTNHYLGADRKPEAAINPWSKTRFERLEERVKSPVTPAAAWDALSAVTADKVLAGTLHSLVVLPERRTLDVAFATTENGRLVASTKRPRVTIAFDDLFNKPTD